MKNIYKTNDRFPWRFDSSFRGRRVVKKFKSKTEAEAFAKEYFLRISQEGARALPFSAKERTEYRKAKELAGGEDLVVVARFWKKHKAKLGGFDKVPVLGDACVSFNELMRDTRSEAHSRHVAHSLKRLVERFGEGMELESIGVPAVSSWVADMCKSLSAKSVRGIHADAVNFFGWCKDVKRWMSSVPAVPSRVLPRMERARVEIWSVEQAEAAMRTVERMYKRFVPYYALRLFAGLRRSEAAQMRWEWIDFDKRSIRVPAEICKTRDDWLLLPSFLPDTVFEWLAGYRAKGGLIGAPNSAREQRIAESGGWCRNVLRHTFATMHVAYYCDEGKTIMATRHTGVQTLRAHYKGVNQSHEDAVRFFGMKPDAGLDTTTGTKIYSQ